VTAKSQRRRKALKRLFVSKEEERAGGKTETGLSIIDLPAGTGRLFSDLESLTGSSELFAESDRSTGKDAMPFSKGQLLERLTLAGLTD
jgi:hypothetical protein